MEKLHLTLEEGTQTVEIRTGEALPLHEPKSLSIIGSLKAPGDFYDKRSEQFDVRDTHVLVNEDIGAIKLVTSDTSEIGAIVVTGQLAVHPDFTKLGVNDPEVVRTPTELANYIKMNRSLFESKQIAMELVSHLRNFKAVVNKKLEETSDDRANFIKHREQAVESNIPEAFKVKMPVFVGEKAVIFSVEIVIDPDEFDCILISPDANDFVRKEKTAQIEEQVKRFSQFAVIYQ